jgi:hypothetical protein
MLEQQSLDQGINRTLDKTIKLSKRQVIAQRLLEEGNKDTEMFKVIILLKQDCIYYTLEYSRKHREESGNRGHILSHYALAKENGYSMQKYEK